MNGVIANAQFKVRRQCIDKIGIGDVPASGEVDFAIGNAKFISVCSLNPISGLIKIVDEIVVILLANSKVGSIDIRNMNE